MTTGIIAVFLLNDDGPISQLKHLACIEDGLISKGGPKTPNAVPLSTSKMLGYTNLQKTICTSVRHRTYNPKKSARLVGGLRRRRYPRLLGLRRLPLIIPGRPHSDALLQNRPLEAVTYFSRAARVRQGVARLDEALLQAESLSSGARLELSVAQLPVTGGDIWAGLPLPPATTPVDRLSILAFGAPATAQAALFVDEWLETVPSASETTGVTFHVDDAKSRAPQAILLGVQADASTECSLESVEGTLLEAIELAHFRAVVPRALR
jgi:hypothetical protein